MTICSRIDVAFVMCALCLFVSFKILLRTFSFLSILLETECVCRRVAFIILFPQSFMRSPTRTHTHTYDRSSIDRHMFYFYFPYYFSYSFFFSLLFSINLTPKLSINRSTHLLHSFNYFLRKQSERELIIMSSKIICFHLLAMNYMEEVSLFISLKSFSSLSIIFELSSFSQFLGNMSRIVPTNTHIVKSFFF